MMELPIREVMEQGGKAIWSLTGLGAKPHSGGQVGDLFKAHLLIDHVGMSYCEK